MTFADRVAEHQAAKLQKLRDETGCVSGTDVPCRSGGRSYSDGTNTLPLGDAIDTVLAQPAVNDRSLSERLRTKVGLGDKPALRRSLFARLERLHRVHRDAIEQVIAEAWAQSAGAHRRDRYFCRSVVCKLAALGLDHRGAVGGVADVI